MRTVLVVLCGLSVFTIGCSSGNTVIEPPAEYEVTDDIRTADAQLEKSGMKNMGR